MPSLQELVTSPTFLRVLYAGNMLWHSSAFIHFSFLPRLIMTKLTTRHLSSLPSIASSHAGDEWHADILAYLGYINVPYAVLAALRLYASFRVAKKASRKTSKLATPGQSPKEDEANKGHQAALSTIYHKAELARQLDILALLILCLANASQAYGNFFRSRPSGRWIMGTGLDRITVFDALFTVLDAVAVLGLVRK